MEQPVLARATVEADAATASRPGPRSLATPSTATGRRHICIVTDTYPPEVNGVAMTLARLVSGLRDLGHAVSVLRPLRAFHNRAAGTIVASTALGEHLRAAGFTNLAVLGRGVDSELFTPAR